MSGMAAFGTLLKRGDGATSETFTTIAQATSISGPNLEAEQIDVTSHDSPNRFEEFVAGIKRGGEVELELNFDPSESTHEQILDDFDGAVQHNFQLVFPTSPAITWTFAAIVTAFSPEAPFDDKLAATATFKLTGPVTRP